jgi:hypothetical protein
MRTVLVFLTLGTAFLWFVLATDRTNIADASCPAKRVVVRYPEHLGGPHEAVCNPTGINWR